ncbi:S41 family peptidase [Undibacterium sp. 5I1]|nr:MULTISPECIES: S41 family peptidase [unclassified Undibacterium]MDY7540250.1 S41 family peptidase [Undibacterium sp. 5I1]MEB0231394.1 S41 family peptidase [Undibacterium sp. 10I3]MEB0257177.1 S41 family peptidase [Undibacterium sp. 5I1]
MSDTVFADKNHETISKVEPDKELNKSDYLLKNIAPDFSGNDRITRIGNAIQIWNALRYFYPYSDIIKIDWDKELDTLLSSASSDKDEKAFTHTLMRFTSALHDGHTRVTGPRELDTFSPFIKIKMIDGVPIVARSSLTSGNQPLIPFGSEITRLNGLPIAHRLSEINKENLSATDTMQDGILSVELLTGEENSNLEISYRDTTGFNQTKTFLRDTPIVNLREENPLGAIQQLKSGIWYVDIDRADSRDIEQLIVQKNNIKGIIFDVRNYVNSGTINLLSHFTKKPLEVPLYNVPVISGPERDHWQWERLGKAIQPQAPYIDAKLVFLISGNTISAAETLMTIVEHYKLGEIIGTRTAGSNGNITCLPLPGGYKVFWTGMQVLKQDGSQFHGIGIIPTVPYKITIEDAISGHDVMLEKAMNFLTEK